MSSREDALEFMEKFISCVPKNFFSKVEETQKGMGFILIYLNRAEKEVVAGDLARELNVSTARIAALLKKMEANRFIIRRSCPQDARKTVVEIAPEGSEQLNRMKKEFLRKAELVLDRIGKKDLEEFLRISYRIKEVIEEEDL